MTVEDTTSKQLAQQMGNSFEYPFTFTVLLSDPTEEDAKKAIKAKVKSAEGIITDLVYNSEGDDGYSVVLNDNRNGGVLTVNNKRTNNDYITIYREYEETQEADYQDFNAAPAETYEQNFDKLTMLSQQHQEQLDRCIKVEMMSDVSPEVLVEEVQRVWESIENIDIVSNDKVNIDNVAQNIEDINTCAENINAIADASNQAQNAALSAQIAQQSKNNAQIWAQGTDEEVQSLGGIHSSKGWAELATGGGADRDLSNLTLAGEAHFLNKTQITNTILSSLNPSITPKSYNDTAYINHGVDDASGVLSGFSAVDFAILAKTMTNSTSWVFTLPVTTGADLSGIQPLIGINNKDNCVQLNNGVISLVANKSELKGDTVLSASSDYTLVFTRTPNGYTLEIKSNADVIDSINLPSSYDYFGGKTIYLGNNQTQNYFHGSIDLTNASITSDSETYWDIETLVNAQTVEIKGQFNLLMPNYRAINNTYANLNTTLNIDSVILYDPIIGTKTIVVTQDGELLVRNNYIESFDQPKDLELNTIWLDKNENIYKEQISNLPNIIQTGNPIFNSGVITFPQGSKITVPQSFNLGNNFNITLPITTPQSAPDEEEIIFSDGENGNFETILITYTPQNQISAKLRREDVYVVNKETIISTAYEVKNSSQSQTGYVQTQGEEGSYVAANTQIYSDTSFETPLTQASGSDWTYTGDFINNSQITTGYTKLQGTTLVPQGTIIYTDADCTTQQAQATGSDYVYTGITAPSYITTLTLDALNLSTQYDISLNYDSLTYTLSDGINNKTFNSSDTLNNTSPYFNLSDETKTFSGAINLSDTEIEINNSPAWSWNGIADMNFEIVGNLSLNNGILSGFDAVSYGVINKEVPENITSLEMYATATMNAFDAHSEIFAQVNANRTSPQMGMTAGNNFSCEVSPDGTSWVSLIFNSNDGITSEIGQTYNWFMTWDIESKILTFKVKKAQDETFTLSKTATLDAINWTDLMAIGMDQIATEEYFRGSIDLNNSYIKVNNKTYFQYNKVKEASLSLIPFVGAKIGEIEDNGTTITKTRLNYPLALAKEEDVILKSKEKDFLNTSQITNCILEAPNGVAQWSGVTPTGTLVNNQGVVSGFSTSNYLMINKIPNVVNSFEMEFCATTGSVDLAESQVITGQEAYKNYLCPQLGVDGYSEDASGDGGGKLCVGCGVSDSEWGEWIYSINRPTANTTYWLRVVWDGTTIYFYLKTSKEAAWELQGTTQQSHVEWSSFMALGVDGASESATGNKIWTGSIDLSQSYIKINGKMWWQGNDLGFNQFRVKEGLKTLIPNGRNEDGTLRNIEFTVDSDFIYAQTSQNTYFYLLLIKEETTKKAYVAVKARFMQGLSYQMPVTVETIYPYYYYATDENFYYYTTGSTTADWKPLYASVIGEGESTNGNIISFVPYNPVTLVSWDDESYKKSVYGYILPDYTAAIDMGLTASSPYTAPCDGWVIGLYRISGTSKGILYVNDTPVARDDNDNVCVYLPLKAKDKITTSTTPYNVVDEADIRFYPCKGAYNV